MKLSFVSTTHTLHVLADTVAALGVPLARAGQRIGHYLAAYKQAQAAAHVYQVLSHMSEADLARQGLSKGEIAERVRQLLSEKS